MLFTLFNMTIQVSPLSFVSPHLICSLVQEAEYRRYFEFLKSSAVERRSSLGDEEFRDIVSSYVAPLCFHSTQTRTEWTLFSESSRR
jgi:hypothetical protein